MKYLVEEFEILDNKIINQKNFIVEIYTVEDLEKAGYSKKEIDEIIRIKMGETKTIKLEDITEKYQRITLLP